MARKSLSSALAGAGGAAQDGAAPAPVTLPGEVQDLLREREALEARMLSLTGGGAEQGAGAGRAASSAPDPRYPVVALAERRAADALWARGRDEGREDDAPPPRPRVAGRLRSGLDTLRETAVERAKPAMRSGLRDLFAAPEAPALRAMPDAPPLRGLALPDPLNDALHMRNDPSRRTLGTDLPVPRLRPLAELAERGARVADRLDTLRGGSGDLDALRETARARRRDRRAEERPKAPRKNDDTDRDRRRDDARLNRKKGERDV